MFSTFIVIIGCDLTSKSSNAAEENIKYFKNLKVIDLRGDDFSEFKNSIGRDGFEAIFQNAKYLTNLEVLSLEGNINNQKIDNKITPELSHLIYNNIKYLKSLREVNLGSK